MRAAEANTLALDEQAVETTAAGPSSPKAVRTKSASEERVVGRAIVEVGRQGAGRRVARR